jgi:hypothetical protein
MLSVVERHVIARESNVVRVDFGHEPDPPAPCFPGASGLRLSHIERGEEDAPAATAIRGAGTAPSEHDERAPNRMHGGVREFRKAS